MSIIPLSNWDTSGKLTANKPRQSDSILSLLGGAIQGYQKRSEGERLRTAAGTALGVPPESLRGVSNEQLQKITTEGAIEKFKASLTPKEYKAQTEEASIREELAKHPERGAVAKMYENANVGGGGVIYRDSTTGMEVPAEKAIPEIAQGNTNYIISRKEISKSGVKEVPISKPEDLEKGKALKNKSEFIVGQAQDSLNTIAEVKKGKKYFGAVGSVPTLNPWGYDRKKWEANVQKLLSGKMIDLMVQMKEASKTGATGFGQLSEREGQILRDASTALNRGLAPEDAEKYLTEMETILHKIVNKQGGQPISPIGQPPQGQPQKAGGVPMEDAQGNKAMVYPDGSFEEIQ